MLKVLKKFGLTTADLITVYIVYICLVAEYPVLVWHPSLNDKQSASSERIQKRALRIVFGTNPIISLIFNISMDLSMMLSVHSHPPNLI